MDTPQAASQAAARRTADEHGTSPGWAPMLAIGLGYFMVILDATAVNLTLPALGRDLRGGVSALQWVLDSYTLAFAALLLTAGVAADRIGPRRAFLGGLTVFTAASAGCGLAPNVAVLVLLRALQGGAAAMLVPASLALLQASYADRAARARAVGAWGAIAGMAAASGPVLGGALTALATWRLVFALNVPVGLVAVWLTRRRVAAPAGRPGARTDPAGQTLAVLALAALTAALIEAGPRGWASPRVLGGLMLAALAAAGFLAAERRAKEPMLPLRILRHPTLAAGTAVGLLLNLGFYGQLFVVSLYLQQVRGDSPLLAGLALLPEAAVVPAASVLSGRLTSRAGPRVTMLAGLAVGCAGLAGLAAATPDAPYLLLAVPLLATGAGTAVTMPAVTSAVLESAPAGRAGLASGLINSSRQVGSAVGVALMGGLIAARTGIVPGLPAAFGACALAFLAGLGIAALAGRAGRRGGTQNETENG